jgi:predicted ATPase
LVLDNVRCFAHAEVPLAAGVTVIIGPNGAGKTSIAEAIASLASGREEGLDEFPLRRGESAGAITLYGEDSNEIARWTAASDGETRARLPSTHHVFVYGQYRGLRPPPKRRRAPLPGPALLGPEWDSINLRPLPSNLADAQSRPTTRTLTDFDEYLFRDLSAYVALLQDDSIYQPAWERLRDWLQRLDPRRIERVEITEQEGRRVAVFVRGKVALSITELSDGYRSMLAVVLDLAIRYTQIFSGLDNAFAGVATVVIDEVDLNLHPRWQRRIIEQLTSLFPGTRFVLTTHSPAVVQAAIDERAQGIRILVLDEEETPGAGTTVRPLKADELRRLDGAEVDSVLVDDAVFDVASRYSPTYEKVEQTAATLREKLEAGTATARERKALLAALDELQVLLAHEEEREGTGPLMSEIAKTQIALLKHLEQAMTEEGGKKRDSTPAKRR